MSGWTIDELADLAAKALATAGVRAPSGRVTAMPDRRVIRWYATIGLLDPPLRARGRTARYGERHLLQLVAVKRRQAEGRTLTEIQAELGGATDTTLRRIADVPTLTPAPSADPGRGRERFWTETAGTDLSAAPAPPVRAARVDGSPAGEPPVPPAPTLHYSVPLHPGVSLTLPARPDGRDLAAIHAAAGPLLELLAARGLLTDSGRPR